MTKQVCASEFPWCPPDAKEGDYYKVRLSDLSPTQFAVGKAEVEVKAARLTKRLKKDPQKLHDYLLVRPVPIVVRGKRFYLFDEAGGGPQQPQKLPAHIKDLASDPYRSLAWIVREHHGYMKTDAPFSEFKWANFFRTRILLDQDILAGRHTFDDFAFEVDAHGRPEFTDDGKEVIEESLSLTSTAEARGLPGFRGSIS